MDQHNAKQQLEVSENELIAQRRLKLTQIREQREAYPNDFKPEDTAQQLSDLHQAKDKAELEAENIEVSLAGRIITRRIMGKASFAHIQDRSGKIQIYVQRDTLAEGVYNEEFKKWDIGDIIACRGVLFKTNKGEFSVKVTAIQLLAKSLRPLPEKFHGLSDKETAYRQRYVDLIVNPESRKVFQTRTQIIHLIRDFLLQREYLEVETPMMQVIPGGASARPFVTHHNALDLNMYLRIAPELYLKRLVVGGFERVFEINRNFRNEGLSTRHNPEFTMLEFYQAYADYEDLMSMTEEMLKNIAHALSSDAVIHYQGLDIDFAKPFTRISVADAILQYNPSLSKEDLSNREALEAYTHSLKVPTQKEYGLGKLQIEIFEATVEDKLLQPTFITQYPVEVSPLSRKNDTNPFITDRFELFIGGREIANGFSELNDPEDQASRFKQQVEAMQAGDEEAMHYDVDYIRALEYGMPPTAGEGIGIDRLVMLFTDCASIRDVLLFPHMRPESPS